MIIRNVTRQMRGEIPFSTNSEVKINAFVNVIREDAELAFGLCVLHENCPVLDNQLIDFIKVPAAVVKVAPDNVPPVVEFIKQFVSRTTICILGFRWQRK